MVPAVTLQQGTAEDEEDRASVSSEEGSQKWPNALCPSPVQTSFCKVSQKSAIHSTDHRMFSIYFYNND